MIKRVVDEKKIKKLAHLLDGAKRIVITTHLSPDGDAMGSSLALARVLSEIGKDVAVIVPDQPLQQLMFLPGAKDVIVGSRYADFAAKLFAKADLIICLDFNELRRIDRLAPYVEASKAAKVMIDHHLHPGDFADVVISHPEMSSTCLLLFRILCRLELFGVIDKDAATCILAGMMTDTGNFAYNCNDPELYIVLAELLRKGADKEKLNVMLFGTFSEHCLRLRAYAMLRKLEVFHREHGALITLSRDELNRFHYTRGDTEGLVNQPLAIPGVDFSVFMRQESDCIRVSMRSRGDFPVNILCSDYFGGGGHLNAAGGEYFGTLDEAIEYFKSKLPEIRKRFIDKK